MRSFSEDSKKFLRKNLLKKKLSKRETEVVMLVLEGFTDREVAHNLCVSVKTVKFHLTNVYKKLNISRRSQIFWQLPLSDFISINEKLDGKVSVAKPLADIINIREIRKNTTGYSNKEIMALAIKAQRDVRNERE